MDLFGERALPTLDENIVSGNSLIDIDFHDGELDFKELKKIKPLSFKTQFKEVFDDGGFDIVIGNPPYVDFRILSKNQVSYLETRFKSLNVKEKCNLYVPFLEIGTKVLREGGYFAMIIPNAFLSANFGIEIRRLLVKEKTIYKIINVSKISVFEQTATYPVLFFYRNEYKNMNFISVGVAKDTNLKKIKKNYISQNEIKKNNDNYIISLNSNKSERSIIRKLDSNSVKLGSIAEKFHWGSSISGFKSYKIKEQEYNKLPENKKNIQKLYRHPI